MEVLQVPRKSSRIWSPSAVQKVNQVFVVFRCSSNKLFGAPFQVALADSSGKIRFVSKAGRTEKTFDAHRGAVIDLRWSSDGASLLSGAFLLISFDL
jgi:hypothetical protein